MALEVRIKFALWSSKSNILELALEAAVLSWSLYKNCAL